MRTLRQKCLATIAVTVLSLVLLPWSVQAGPSVHRAAEPDFQDPLSGARPTAADTDLANNVIGNLGNDGVRLPSASNLGLLNRDEGESLEQVETDDITRTVRDEFLGQGPFVTDRDAQTGLESGSDQSDGSSVNILQSLINAVPGEGAASGSNSPGQNSNGNGGSSSLLDATLNNLLITILNPDLTTEGMVTFSIAGFGEFALLLLQESGGIFLVDMESGTAVKFSENPGTRITGPQTSTTGTSAKQERGSSNALQRVLDILERNVLPIITSPITLLTVVLFGIIWSVWRISARA